jgi:integrase
MARHKEHTLKVTKRIGSPYYQISGTYNGQRVRESTGQKTLARASIELVRIMDDLDCKMDVSSTFNQVSDVHLSLITKKTANKDCEYSKKLGKFFGDTAMSDIGFRPKQFKEPFHPLNQYLMTRAKHDLSITTINKELAFLNLLGQKAVVEYGLLKQWTPVRLVDRDEATFYGFNPPGQKLALQPEWQVTLLNHLPEYLRDAALFSINTGQRDSVVCSLQWDWLDCDGKDTMWHFKVPASFMKSSREAYVVLNDVATKIVDKYKGNGSPYVFTDNAGWALTSQHCYAYRMARSHAGDVYPEIRNTDVHSYKRTFITNLYNAGVPHDWVQRLANHKLPDVTELYNVMGPEMRITMHGYLQRLCNITPTLRLQKGVANGA